MLPVMMVSIEPPECPHQGEPSSDNSSVPGFIFVDGQTLQKGEPSELNSSFNIWLTIIIMKKLKVKRKTVHRYS